MLAVKHAIKRPVGDGVGLGVRLLERRHEPRLLAFQHRLRKDRPLEHAGKDVERPAAFLAARKRPQRKARAIGVEISRKLCADIRHPARDLVFIHAVRTEAQQPLGHARRT